MNREKNTQLAIEINGLLARACELLNDLNTGLPATADATVYAIMCQVSEARRAIAGSEELGQVLDRQAVIDASIAGNVKDHE